MKNKLPFVWRIICLTSLFCAQNAFAQSGGIYEITQTVTATGNRSSGGTFSIENTGGQPLAGGFATASNYSLDTGFWTPPNFVPTAANVSISGRVTTGGGQGIRNILITLTDSSGAIRTAQTATFGYYHFADVRVGENYVLAISSKRYIFSNPARILKVADELTDLDFIADN